jgi:type VI secretion system protein ImpH
MAATNRQTSDSLIAQMTAEPEKHDFFAAVRLLQGHFRDLPRVGHSLSPSQDGVRFAQSPFLEFAPSTVEAVRQQSPDHPPVIYSRHFGVFGPNGPLPLCMTEYARERILHHGDKTFASFCNVFHHRLLSFFFAAWAESRKTVDFDRPEDQKWSSYVGALAGLGMRSLRSRDTVPDRAKLYYSGRLANQTRNAEGIEAIVQDFFGIKTEVETFAGRWMDLPSDAACQLGVSPSTGALGTTIIVGRRVWTCQLSFRLRLGPMKLSDLKRLLPSEHGFALLRDWVRLYCGEEYMWDIKMVLEKEEVPAVQLGRGSALGWTSWLKTQPFEKDADDLTLQGAA